VIRERPARRSDLVGIHRLVDYYARGGILLPRTEADIRARLGRFLVLEENGQVIACVALEPYADGEAELRSVAVDPSLTGRGYGKHLIDYALTTARRRRFLRVFVVSRSPDFFLRRGFFPVPRLELSQKIERDCRRCSRAPGCNLSAAVFFLSLQPPARPPAAVLSVLRV